METFHYEVTVFVLLLWTWDISWVYKDITGLNGFGRATIFEDILRRRQDRSLYFSSRFRERSTGSDSEAAKHGGCWLDNLLEHLLSFFFYYRCQLWNGDNKRPGLNQGTRGTVGLHTWYASHVSGASTRSARERRCLAALLPSARQRKLGSKTRVSITLFGLVRTMRSWHSRAS